jgi:DNA (cytosine-5)-methyltransferase 1
MTVAGLFAGIGGVETGLEAAGHRTCLLCEQDPGAQAVLQHHFPGIELASDVRDLTSLPDVDLVTAGFPCQDLSQAGRLAGIEGSRSGLVNEVFRLLATDGGPRSLLLENVSFMLSLDKGRAMRLLLDNLETLGFRWAYRLVDTRSFGLPQRRRRVFLLAARDFDPWDVLLADDAGEPDLESGEDRACGFYWTEGNTGVGWAVDAIPTLKGGSAFGIPSPPAIRLPDGTIGMPDIRDAERLQGFPEDWTLPAVEDGRTKRGMRWKMVGNAVSVPVSKWIGERLRDPGAYVSFADSLFGDSGPLPKAAWGANGKRYRASVSEWPVRTEARHLQEFLRHDLTPLSYGATKGFYDRLSKSRLGLKHDRAFMASLEANMARMGGPAR